MPESLQLLIFGKNLATGILAPVLTLALLSHGATLATVSLLIGVYSLTVIVAEFPSGVYADCHGRKNAFAVAMLLNACGIALLLAASSPAALAAAMVLMGLGRAFSSGSVDALALDAASDDRALARVSSRLSVLESAGLAAGSVAGALLSGLDVRYSWNLGVHLAVDIALFAVTCLAVPGVPLRRPSRGRPVPARYDPANRAEPKGQGTSRAPVPELVLRLKRATINPPTSHCEKDAASGHAPEHADVSPETAGAEHACSLACLFSEHGEDEEHVTISEHGMLSERREVPAYIPTSEHGTAGEHKIGMACESHAEHGFLRKQLILRKHAPVVASPVDPKENETRTQVSHHAQPQPSDRLPHRKRSSEQKAERDLPPASPPFQTGPKVSDDAPQAHALAAQIRTSFAFVLHRGMPRRIFLLTTVTGLAMLAVETYWQPALSSFSPAPWGYGVLSLTGYLCVMLASRLAGRALASAPRAAGALLFAQKIAMGLCLIVLLRLNQREAFVGGYTLYSLLLGGSGVAESTLINRDAPSAQRASILSLFSLVLQLGGLAGSLAGFVINRRADYRLLWLVAGGLLALVAVTLAFAAAREARHGASFDGRNRG